MCSRLVSCHKPIHICKYFLRLYAGSPQYKRAVGNHSVAAAKLLHWGCMISLDTPEGLISLFAHGRKRPVEGTVEELLQEAIDASLDFVPFSRKAHYRINLLLLVVANKANPRRFPHSDRRAAFLPAGLKPMIRFLIAAYTPDARGIFQDVYRSGLVQLTRKTVAKVTGVSLSPYEFRSARKLLISAGLMAHRTMLEDARGYNGSEFWVRLVMPEFQRLVNRANELATQGPDWLEFTPRQNRPRERGMARPRINPEAFIAQHGGLLLVSRDEQRRVIQEAVEFETEDPFGDCIDDLMQALHGKKNRYHERLDGRRQRLCPQAKDLLRIITRLAATRGAGFRRPVPPILRGGKLYFLVNASWLRDAASMTQGQYSRELRLFKDEEIVEVLRVSKDVIGIAVDFARIDELCRDLVVWKRAGYLPHSRAKTSAKVVITHRAWMSSTVLQAPISHGAGHLGAPMLDCSKQKRKNSPPFGLRDHCSHFPGKARKTKPGKLKLGLYTPACGSRMSQRTSLPPSPSRVSEYLPASDEQPAPPASVGGNPKVLLDEPFDKQHCNPEISGIIDLFRGHFNMVTHAQARTIRDFCRAKIMSFQQVQKLLWCIGNGEVSDFDHPDGDNPLGVMGFTRKDLTLDAVLNSWQRFREADEFVLARRRLNSHLGTLGDMQRRVEHFGYESVCYGAPGLGHRVPQFFTLEEWTVSCQHPERAYSDPCHYIPLDPVTALMKAAEHGGWDPQLVEVLRQQARSALYRKPEIYAAIDFCPKGLPRRHIFGLSSGEARRLRRLGRNAIITMYWSLFRYHRRALYIQLTTTDEEHGERYSASAEYAEEKLRESIDRFPFCLAWRRATKTVDTRMVLDTWDVSKATN
jgi:hypothetical protein